MKFKKIIILGLSLFAFNLTLTSCNSSNVDKYTQTLSTIVEDTDSSNDNVNPDVEKVTLTIQAGSSEKRYDFPKGTIIKVSELKKLTGLQRINRTIQGFYYDSEMNEKIKDELEITENLKIYVKYGLRKIIC
jgi:hypothetical protein